MAKVYVHEGEEIDVAIKRFNKKVMKEDLMNEIRKRQYYRKPSDIKKEKQRRAQKLQAAALAKQRKFDRD